MTITGTDFWGHHERLRVSKTRGSGVRFRDFFFCEDFHNLLDFLYGMDPLRLMEVSDFIDSPSLRESVNVGKYP